jgi:hypothetical protein
MKFYNRRLSNNYRRRLVNPNVQCKIFKYDHLYIVIRWIHACFCGRILHIHGDYRPFLYDAVTSSRYNAESS